MEGFVVIYRLSRRWLVFMMFDHEQICNDKMEAEIQCALLQDCGWVSHVVDPNHPQLKKHGESGYLTFKGEYVEK